MHVRLSNCICFYIFPFVLSIVASQLPRPQCNSRLPTLRLCQNSHVDMAKELSLMDMPQEVLLVILKEHFCHSTYSIKSLHRRSPRNNPARTPRRRDVQGGASCTSILLVNKLLLRIGIPCFYNFAEFECSQMFQDTRKLRLNWTYSQLPWNQIKHISGDSIFAQYLVIACRKGLLSVGSLRNVNIHSEFVVLQSFTCRHTD